MKCDNQVQRDRSRFATLQLQNLANAWRKQAYDQTLTTGSHWEVSFCSMIDENYSKIHQF